MQACRNLADVEPLKGHITRRQTRDDVKVFALRQRPDGFLGEQFSQRGSLAIGFSQFERKHCDRRPKPRALRQTELGKGLRRRDGEGPNFFSGTWRLDNTEIADRRVKAVGQLVTKIVARREVGPAPLSLRERGETRGRRLVGRRCALP